MKKLMNVLIVLGVTSLGFSQNTNGKIKREKLNDIVITNVNFNYLQQVHDSTTAQFVNLLETEAAMYNVKDESEFDGRNQPFLITFRGSKGFIIAAYDKNGKIIQTTENYKDIRISKNLAESVLKQFPKSSFLKAYYTVNYDSQKQVEKTYKLKIKQGNIIKNLRINVNDNAKDALSMNIVN